MGRAVKDARTTTKNARKNLDDRKAPFWRALGEGVHLGYHKGTSGGTWIARYRLLKPKKSAKGSVAFYITKTIGIADDGKIVADGQRALDYGQAQNAVETWRGELIQAAALENKTPSYTVADAMADYLVYYGGYGKLLKEVSRQSETLIVPKLGAYAVEELDSAIVSGWHKSIAAAPARIRGAKGKEPKNREAPKDPDGIRRRRATANRILTTLKAALNYAFNEGKVADNSAWRRAKPFKNVDAPKIKYLTISEAQRLINACPPDFRKLVQGALFTGCRYGELIAVEVGDVNPDNKMLFARYTKGGEPRHVPLTSDGFKFFDQLTAGRAGTAKVFLRDDGSPWGKSHQNRRLKDACKIAKIKPAISFHILRHTYGSWLAMNGVSLQVIAEALGHKDTRITARHYAHLAPSYVADKVRANLPRLKIKQEKAVTRLRGRG